MPERQVQGVGNFATKFVAMTTSLMIFVKEGRIGYLQFNIYHMVQRLRKSVQRILIYFGSERKKSGMIQNWLSWQHPLRYWNRSTDLSSTPKTFSYGVKLQKLHMVCIFLTTQNWLPWQRPLRNRKNLDGSRKFMQIASIWWKKTWKWVQQILR